MADNTMSHLPDGDASSVPLKAGQHTSPSQHPDPQQSPDRSQPQPQQRKEQDAEPLSDFPPVANLSTSASSSITVTHRTERSWMMHLLHIILKPINGHVIKPRKVFPPGSPQLKVPKRAKKWCDVEERKVEGMWVYDITAKVDAAEVAQQEGAEQRGRAREKKDVVDVDADAESSDAEGASKKRNKRRKKRVYYFAGGGWQMPASGEHWAFLAELARRLPSTTISLVSYPLAPRCPAPVAFPRFQTIYTTLLAQSARANEHVILAGDSAGGNIALCLVTSALAASDSAPAPAAVFAMSPSTDLRRHNPAIRVIEKHDPLLRIPFINSTARAWCGGDPTQASDPTPTVRPKMPLKAHAQHYTGERWEAGDPRVSPIRADVKPLARRGVRVHGLTGTHDILAPDAVLFREKCREAGVAGSWLEWERQMHCFPLAFSYGFPECTQAVEWCLGVLGREGE